eukprot:NODE_2604_length_2182_cov_6.175669.p1 GENE.NODE_2604_length_2182_cov_6.175669~~NODE_2604_length_2182_cov_6.175669.p1  ORF type:complete len:455 (-),score=75.86 NODE_2604_length_2182_cov_6.175669:202-1566(-)
MTRGAQTRPCSNLGSARGHRPRELCRRLARSPALSRKRGTRALQVDRTISYLCGQSHGSYLGRPTVILISEYFFVSFYTSELLFKLAVFRLNFFTNSTRAWNIFDMVLVVTAVYDLLNDITQPEGEGSNTNMTMMRLVRLLKMLKMLRMVRVMRFFRELRLMLYAFAGSVRPLFWSMVMLGLIMYIFGLCFLQAATAYVEELPETGRTEDQVRNVEELEQYWGSVTKAMQSLYWAITGGNDWKPLAQPLKATGYHYYALFIIYVAFLTFAVLNVLTGIFVDAAMSVAAKDRDTVVHQELVLAQEYSEGIMRVLDTLDDGQGYVSLSDVEAHMSDPGVNKFFAVLDLTITDVRVLFKTLGDGRGQRCAIEVLLNGCTCTKGRAKSIDIFALMFQNARYMSIMDTFIDYIEVSLEAMLTKLDPKGRSQPSIVPISKCISRASRQMFENPKTLMLSI